MDHRPTVGQAQGLIDTGSTADSHLLRRPRLDNDRLPHVVVTDGVKQASAVGRAVSKERGILAGLKPQPSYAASRGV